MGTQNQPKAKRRAGFTGVLFLLGLTLFPGPGAARAQPPVRESDSARRFDHAAQQAFLDSLDADTRRRAVQLKSRAFVPGADAAVYAASDALHVYAQFERILNDTDRSALLQLGIEVREYVTNQTYVVYCAPNTARHLRTHPLVMGVAPIAAADKVPAGVWQCMQGAGAPVPDAAPRRYRVRVYAGADPVETMGRLAGMGLVAELVEHGTQLALEADLTDDALCAVAAVDGVSAVEPSTPPRIPHNANARVYTRANVANAAPYSLDGSGVTVLVRDEDFPRHADYNSRLTVLDDRGDGVPSRHHTHVTGTVAGSGAGLASATGMAPAAAIVTHDFLGLDTPEIRDPWLDNDAKLSNHSYGVPNGWDGCFDSNGSFVNCYYAFTSFQFGNYNGLSNLWDNIVYGYDTIIVKSAGNARNAVNASGSSHLHPAVNNSTFHTDAHPDNGPYNSINGASLAKNIITVGAVNHDNNMSSFSSYGPPQDGRVKPDVVSDGVALLSTLPGNSYGTFSGTSMSAPATTGSLVLFLEFYRDVLGRGATLPSAAATKACLIHGARDLTAVQDGGVYAGDYRTGPDYATGYGAVDVVNTITALAGLREDTVDHGQSDTYIVTVPDSSTPIKATLVWIDPPGSTVALNAIVNNLDLRITGPGGPYLPWVLDPNAPANAATTGVNAVDPVEQVLIDAPPAGTYTVTVAGTSVPQGPQGYALVLMRTGCAVRVGAPNGGESVPRGLPFTLRWVGDVPGDQVNLELWRSGARVRTIATGQNETGQFAWAPPADLPLGSGYELRIATADGSCGDVSDATFTITDLPCEVNVTSPDGGEIVQRGQARNLTWTGTVPGSLVTVDLWRDGVYQQTLTSNLANTGTFTWHIPVGMPLGPGYQLVVRNADGSCRDFSNSTFTIVETAGPCALTVLAPNGGDQVFRGQTRTVSWVGSVPGTTVHVLLFRKGKRKATIGLHLPNTGSVTWNVPAGLPALGGYRILVRSADARTCRDVSDRGFTIVRPDCTMAITSPNGGEQVERGNATSITWSGTLPGSTVRLLLFKKGKKHSLIAANVPDTGTYTWNVPGRLRVARNYKIKIQSEADRTCRDFSNTNFSIVRAPCSLTLLGPNGGESITRGAPATITWTGVIPGTTVKLILFKKGRRHSVIASDVVNDGSFIWTVPAGLPVAGNYKIQIQASNDRACRDFSDQNFAITN